MLESPRNAGLMSYRPHRYKDGRRVHSAVGVVGQAKWPAILPRERWEGLQRVLKTRGDRYRFPRRRSLLTSLVVCGYCGATMARTVGRKAATGLYSRHYWTCPSRATGDSCGRLSIDAEGLEGLVVDSILQALDSPDLLAAWRDIEVHEGDAPELLSQLEALDLRRAEVASRYASGAIPISMLEQVTQLIEDDRERIQRELAGVAGSTSLQRYAGKPGLLRQQWASLDLDAQRTILFAAIDRVEIKPSGPRRGAFDPNRVVISWRI